MQPIGYQFISMDVFNGADRAKLLALNPTMKIPMLDDSGTIIFDSRAIFNYVGQRHQYAPLSIESENRLTMIDAANDSMVQLLILKRSEIDINSDKLFFRLQRERIAAVLSQLQEDVAKGVLEEWSYPAICLYCMLDWNEYRQIIDVSEYKVLKQFMVHHQHQQMVSETDPRLT